MRSQYRPDDYRLRQQRRALRNLLPLDKNDLDAVKRLVDAGYPSVEPILADLVMWIRDPEWPVCNPMAAFLAQIGAPAVPHRDKSSTDSCVMAPSKSSCRKPSSRRSCER
jgi:hypothetical protein